MNNAAVNSAAMTNAAVNSAAVSSAAVAEIRAFGPLTVAGRTVPRPRERTLLVAAHGQPVTGSRLAGQLWHGEPPPSAQTALQVAASRLRALVEPGRPPRGPARHVVSVGDGYALRLPADAVDLWRFAAAARRARGLRRASASRAATRRSAGGRAPRTRTARTPAWCAARWTG